MTSHLHKLPIKHKNFILEDTRILQIQCFLPKLSTFENFFKVKQTQNLLCLYVSGKLGFPGASKHLMSLAHRQVDKKINFDP